ncbi:hypothetical protein FHETE_10794 [Fusarium heterosporum]|uniref:Rhodopsin domain-containing protein n=1 Tax=Fusarium heterosporum TaxID=42747 RepID=A0A8H5WFR1_FUSHE|nr:hypothetical protein FHETE_10794 [Fusarium heterosporum]
MAASEVLIESKQHQLSLVAWVFTGMAIATVLTKSTTTIVVFRRPGWDDLMILLSMCGSIVASAIVQASVDLGLGRRTAVVVAEPGGAQRMAKTTKLQIIAYPFNIIAYSLPNVAILVLIERLVGGTEAISRQFLRGVVACQLILATASIIIIFVQCRPPEFMWDQTIDGTCWNPDVFNYSSYIVSGFTALTDLILAVVPIHAFWKLKLKLQEKLEITFMLGLTLLSAILTIIKATYMDRFNDRTDPLYNVVILITWGLIEQNVVIMAASVPTLRPLFRLLKDKYPMRSAINYAKSGSGTVSKRTGSASEIQLDRLNQQLAQGSQQSFEAHSLHDWIGKEATARFE